MTKHLHSCEEFFAPTARGDSVSEMNFNPSPGPSPRYHPAVILDHLGFRHGGKAEILHDISATLPTGSFHYLYGDTGAGKSTLLRIIGTDLSPTRGTITLFDQQITPKQRENMVAIRRYIGIQSQDCRLIDHMSVAENIALPLRLQRHPDADNKEHIHELLAWMGLGDYAQTSPATLSPGIRQNIALARAIMHRPALLLLDEPLAWQDDRLTRRTMHLLANLNDQGTTIILATRDHRLIQRYPYPCLWLRDGSLNMLGINDLHHIIQMPPTPTYVAPTYVVPVATEHAFQAHIIEAEHPLSHSDETPAAIPEWPDYEQLLSPLRHIERWRR